MRRSHFAFTPRVECDHNYSFAMACSGLRRVLSRTVFSLVLLSTLTPFSNAWISGIVPLHQSLVVTNHEKTRLQSPTCYSMLFMEEPSSAAAAAATSAPASSVDRFHADMRRVLESRRHRMEVQNMTHDDIKNIRNHRPLVLESDVDGAERVHGLLQVLCERGLATEESFQIVLQAYVNRGRIRWRPPSIPNVAEDDDENSIEDSSNTHVTTNASLTQEINILSARKHICAADQAEVLLQQLLQRIPGHELSIETYNLVLEAYANCATPRGGERNYAQRAQSLLERLRAIFGQVPLSSLLHVLHATAWQQANKNTGVYAEQAKVYLEEICERTNDPGILLQAYSWTLEAFSKSGSAGSALVADLLLEEMIQINATDSSHETEQISSKQLDAEDFSNAILAWSKANDARAAPRAQERLEQMVTLYRAGAFPEGSEPPLIAFNGVIVAWSRQGDYTRAASILWLLDDVCKTCRSLVPDVVSYNSVLHAYIRSKAPLDKVRSLVAFMHRHCDAQPSIRPNSFTYYTYLRGLLQNQPHDEDDLAEIRDMLSRLEARWLQGDYEMKPTNRMHNMIINAYAKSNDKRAWRTAMSLLDRMKVLAQESPEMADVAPDIITITSVMECLAKAADPQAPRLAQSLLNEAFDRYHQTKNDQDRPNLRTYTMAILTLSKNHGSVVQARQLLDQLLRLYKETGDASLKPNAYPYNYILNCAASSVNDDPTEAFQIATRTFQDLRQAGLADSFTYAFWFKCCIHLVVANDLKEKCIRYAFDECKREGLVTSEVLNRLFQALPRRLVLDDLLEGKVKPTGDSNTYSTVHIKSLPPEWTRRVAGSRRSWGWRGN